MATKRTLTDLQRASLKRLLHDDPQAWKRATYAGERVTLASLYARGLAERRAWRGDGISRDSAFEYRVNVDVSLTYTFTRARNSTWRAVDELDARRASR